ncbi:MAG: VPLPA-CTERM sorting domain-containing protein [Pseudomonadota bacterium]
MLKKAAVLAMTASALTIAPAAFGALSGYSTDFESLNAGDGAALGGDGWKVFANVFEPGGGFLFGYGPFDAPNMSGGFSNVATGEGGPDQGNQQLVVFSDYNNGDAHNAGNLVEANVFQEQIISGSDIGSEWTFSFDAKRGDIGGNSSSLAFIKTLDPNAGFALTNFLIIDTTNIADTWGTFSLSLFIDGSLDGQILQFGFANTATSFEASGVFYDNVEFRPVPLPGAVWLMLSGLAAFTGMRRRAA